MLKAGAAQVDITPELGIFLAGGTTTPRKAEKVLEPIFARAFVLENGSHKICILTFDVTIIVQEYTNQIRKTLCREFGFKNEDIMVHATQTHSAPAMGDFLVHKDIPLPEGFEWLRGGGAGFANIAVQKGIEAVRTAYKKMRPVYAGGGSTIEGRICFNRRAVMQDGSVTMPGREGYAAKYGVRDNKSERNTIFRYLEGPVDPEVGLIAFKDRNDSMVAMLLHYTCHPVNVFPAEEISPDWPGIWAEEMRKKYGCTALVLNGCCGNLNPWDPFDPEYKPDHVKMGRILSQDTDRIVRNIEYGEVKSIGSRIKNISLDMRRYSKKEIKKAQGLLKVKPEVVGNNFPSQEWIHAAYVQTMFLQQQELNFKYRYEIQCLKIENFAIVGLPGEPFSECGLAIKMASPAFPTFTAHCCSHYAGYIPIKDAFKHGGHEAMMVPWSKFKPEAADVIVKNTIELLQKMFKQ
jgi:neutral ceramidase